MAGAGTLPRVPVSTKAWLPTTQSNPLCVSSSVAKQDLYLNYAIKASTKRRHWEDIASHAELSSKCCGMGSFVFPKRRVTRTADRTERQTHSSFASVALDLKPAEAALDTSTMVGDGCAGPP
jgi:hypothetical protein